MAILIVTAAIAGMAQLLHLVAQQQRSAEYRATAVLEAANVMEDLMARSWLDLTTGTSTRELSEVCRARLPDAKLHIHIDREVSDAEAGRITVIIDWQAPTGQRNRPVRLVAWRTEDLAETAP